MISTKKKQQQTDKQTKGKKNGTKTAGKKKYHLLIKSLHC